jgi:hypothetical protein
MPTITTKREISWMDLSNILCAAVEGGHCGSYWLRTYEADGVRGRVPDASDDDTCFTESGKPIDWLGFTITKPNGDEDDGDEPAVNTEITLQSILDALQKIENDPVACELNSKWRFEYDNYDAPMSDCVVQVAVFGRVIYG